MRPVRYEDYLKQMTASQPLMDAEIAKLIKEYTDKGYSCVQIHDELIFTKEGSS